MQRFYGEKRDRFGRVEYGATVSVFTAGTDDLATIYNATDPLANPVIATPNPFTTDAEGRFGFAAPNGSYDVVVIGGNSAIFRRRVTLFDPNNPEFTDIYANQVIFDTSPVNLALTSQGDTYWDTEAETLATVLHPGGGVTLQHGQELYIKCVNKTGSTIFNGQAVYVNDAQGNRPTCLLASALELNSSRVIGVATEDIADNSYGFITTFGIVRNFDTRPFGVDGAILYLGDVPGSLTATPPASTSFLTVIGITLNTTTNGMFFCRPTQPKAFGTDASYTNFDNDGIQHFYGLAQAWNDWNMSVSGAKVPAVGYPNWATVTGNLEAYQFAVNDNVMMEAQEFLHDWKEGSDIHVHLHWITSSANNATPRGVKWQVEFAYANTDFSSSAAYQFPAVTTLISAETTIPANAPALSHFGTSIGQITPTGMKIGAQILMRLKRIAAAGTAPATNPFAISMGIHYQKDTLGSKQIASK